MLLRDEMQAALAELEATAAGLVVRYGALIEGGIDPALRSVLTGAVARRSKLVDAIAACARERGERPSAADRERNEFHALVDRVAARMLGSGLPIDRVRTAERSWLLRLLELEGLEWRTDERRVIELLKADARRTLRRLHALQV